MAGAAVLGQRVLRVTACVCVVVVVAWVLLGLTPKPQLVNRLAFSQRVYDRTGDLLRLELTGDEKLRAWTSIDEISPSLIEFTLLKEDRAFYRHPGFDPAALLRAALATVRGEHQGGSTVTMQVARMRFGLNTRSIAGKLRQIACAIWLERHFTKREILETYFNVASYGGNVEGVEAASLVYFGKRASELSEAESLTLSVVPQHPAARRPGAGPDLPRARSELLRLASASRGARGLDASASPAAAGKGSLPFAAPHLVDRLLSADPYSPIIRSSIDRGLQTLVERTLGAFVTKNRRLGITNGAVILVDHEQMKVRAYAGSADFFSKEIQGQVDGLRGKRSPGSALKPFIYALALEQGLIHSETVLRDIAFARSTYNPENFDREFIGPIGATEALVRSRNLPAIRLANSLSGPSFYEFLKQARVSKMREEGQYGLALALGGMEVSPEELATLYAMLANQGVLKRLSFRESPDREESEELTLLSPEASLVTLRMLERNPRPSGGFDSARTRSHLPIAWKTGTSYGFRDAWAAGVVGQYVLVVWLGNFSGEGNPSFIGREAAGPLFFTLVDSLNAMKELRPYVPALPARVKRVEVCALSGQLPGPGCSRVHAALFIPGRSPIEQCTVHREVLLEPVTGYRHCSPLAEDASVETMEFWSSDVLALFSQAGLPRRVPPRYLPECQPMRGRGAAPTLVSPRAGVHYAMQGHSVLEVPFSAVTDADAREVFWFVDGDSVGRTRSGETFFWKARPGSFVVRAVDNEGRAVTEQLTVDRVS